MQEWLKPGSKSIVLQNHVSNIDPFVFSAITPLAVIRNVRTFLKASLLKLPLFGAINRRCNHFPVYFNSKEQNNFGVDKDRQAEVAAKVEKHIGFGGVIALYPEGQLNRNPKIIQEFRRGSFATALKHQMQIFGMITYGCEDAWPLPVALGGFPSTIYVKNVKLGDASEGKTVEELTDLIQKRFQQEFNQIVEEVSGKSVAERARAAQAEATPATAGEGAGRGGASGANSSSSLSHRAPRGGGGGGAAEEASGVGVPPPTPSSPNSSSNDSYSNQRSGSSKKKQS